MLRALLATVLTSVLTSVLTTTVLAVVPATAADAPARTAAPTVTARPVAHRQTDSLTERIDKLPHVVSVREKSTLEGYRLFVIGFRQPVDHAHPRRATFVQRVAPFHSSVQRPTVLVTDGYAPATFVPAQLQPVRHDTAAMPDIDRWVRTGASRMIFLYGGNDPWSAEKFSCGQSALQRGCHRYVVAGGTHGAQLGNLPGRQRRHVVAMLRRWAGVPPRLGQRPGGPTHRHRASYGDRALLE